jgi:hypothetical protein
MAMVSIVNKTAWPTPAIKEIAEWMRRCAGCKKRLAITVRNSKGTGWGVSASGGRRAVAARDEKPKAKAPIQCRRLQKALLKLDEWQKALKLAQTKVYRYTKAVNRLELALEKKATC